MAETIEPVGPTRSLHRCRRPRLLTVLTLFLALSAGACGSGSGKGASGSTPASEVPPPDSQPSTSVPDSRASPGCRAGPSEGTSQPEQVLDVDGEERSYLISLPAGRDADDPAPLIIEFHGWAGSGTSMDGLTGMADAGSKRGAIVVHPDGTNDTWQISATATDAAFIDALIDELADVHCVDLDRVYLAGFSAGAAFAIIFGCAHQDRIAAIATVAVEFVIGCTQPMSIIAFHGTKDLSVPFQDGAVGLSLPGLKVRGTELNMGDWARLAECDETPTVEKVGSEVIRSTWSGCARGTEVVLNRIEGGGHTWPGADPKHSSSLTTQQIDATDEMISFFEGQHL